MERITLPNQNLSPNFIGSWILNPLSICDELIAYFEENKNKQKRGATAAGENLNFKDSTDIIISPSEVKSSKNSIFEQYLKNLFSFYQDYVTEWPFLTTFAGDLEIGNFNIQRYQSGQHFQSIHAERDSLRNIHRIFAWMTYLNDIDSNAGGSTFFSHYDMEVQPKKGLTLIWPAEWTHAHKGNVLHSDTKYIITGWMHFPNKLKS